MTWLPLAELLLHPLTGRAVALVLIVLAAWALRWLARRLIRRLAARYELPLEVAVAHNGVAVALLFVLVSLLARLRAPD